MQEPTPQRDPAAAACTSADHLQRDIERLRHSIVALAVARVVEQLERAARQRPKVPLALIGGAAGAVATLAAANRTCGTCRALEDGACMNGLGSRQPTDDACAEHRTAEEDRHVDAELNRFREALAAELLAQVTRSPAGDPDAGGRASPGDSCDPQQGLPEGREEGHQLSPLRKVGTPISTWAPAVLVAIYPTARGALYAIGCDPATADRAIDAMTPGCPVATLSASLGPGGDNCTISLDPDSRELAGVFKIGPAQFGLLAIFDTQASTDLEAIEALVAANMQRTGRTWVAIHRLRTPGINV